MRADYADRLAYQASDLVTMVRDIDPQLVGEHLASLDRTKLEHLTITLAAMVPDDQPLSSLLAWCQHTPSPRVVGLRPHGTHAAYARHKTAGQEPCSQCVEGERAYQRERKRRSRQTPLQSVRVA